ncbi:MFGE8 [Cordylochernes scorpioides]|uniref:MFGE8 n=1 Tax=Cordylochernes scorpioides TaxID=51811 RepID=A0ABY6L8Q5_9ARAC|nr:MFGE8 [Cordylochernes scorpioides]
MTRKQNANPWSGKEKMNQERRNPDFASQKTVLLVTFFDIKGIVHYEYLEEGYEGNRCQNNINECQQLNSPCSPESICYDRYGSYVCQCPPGYSGRHCHQRMDECSSRPCQNNGTCVTRSNFSYRCICQTGFTGQACEINVDDCAGVSCPPNSRCQDGIDSYQCVCQDGFSVIVRYNDDIFNGMELGIAVGSL